MEQDSTPAVTDTQVTGGQDTGVAPPAGPTAEVSTVSVGHSQDDSANAAETEEQSSPEATKDGTTASAEGSSEETTAVKYDDDLDEWAQKRGIAIATDNERKLAQMARDNQRDFHKNQQSKVEETVGELYKPDEASGGDTETGRIAAIEQRQQLLDSQIRTNNFFNANPELRDLEPKMAELLQQERESRGVESARWLASDLPRLADLARIQTTQTSTDTAVEQARVEEREAIAKAQAAAAPPSTATTTSLSTDSITPENVEQVYEKLSPDERIARRAEIDAALAA